MKYNEIINALESEIHLAEYVDSNYCDGVNLLLIKSALDLIKRQQAEIEQWKEEANKYQRLWCIAIDDIETAQSEVIKEFADRLKENAHTIDDDYSPNGELTYIEVQDIDNFLKERVGGTE